MDGGNKGAVLVPGDVNGSELVRRLRGESKAKMPFSQLPLPPDQIDLIVRWIEAGLPERGIQETLEPAGSQVAKEVR